MKLTSKQSTHQNGTKDRHQAAVSRRSRSLSPQLPQLLPRPPIEIPSRIPQITMSPSNDLFPPSGLNRLPHPPMMPSPIPPLPAAWEGREEMKVWLYAKMEEDRRKQEEERSYQANVLLEQRRIEQAVITDSLSAGVPPNLVPLIFQGIYTTGANLKLAAELQRQWSAPVQATASTTTPQQQTYPVPAEPAKTTTHPVPPSQNTSQQALQQSHQVSSSESQHMVTSFLPDMSQHPSSAAKSKLHRSRSRSDRERLEQDLKPQKTTPANADPPETELKSESLSAWNGPMHRVHVSSSAPGQSWMWTSERSRAPRAPRPRPPLKYHHWSPQELERPQSRLQPQMLTVDSINALNAQPHVLPEQQIAPSPKRKDERPHEKVPPPRYHLTASVSSRQDYSYGDMQSDQNQQQSDTTNSNESRAYEADSSEQPSESPRVPDKGLSVTPAQENQSEII